MSLHFRIREATLDDNEALIDLVRRCPVEGPIQVALDRAPDFFAFVRLQGPRSQIYVAETLQGDLVGSIVLVENDRDEPHGSRLLRLADLRADPAFRHTRMAAQLLEIYRRKLVQEDFGYGLVETMQGYAPPRKIQRLLGQQVEVLPLGAFDLYQIPLLRSYRTPTDLSLRPAVPADLAELSKLLRASYHGALGAPDFSEGWLDEVTQQHASFGLHHLWLAENHRGEVLACVGIWDQKQLRQTLALRFGRLMKFFIRLLSILGLIWRVPVIPIVGRPLRFAYLRWPACQAGHEKALGTLIRRLMTEVHRAGDYQFLAIGFHEGDPLKQSLRGLLRFKSRMQVYSHRVKRQDSGDPVPLSGAHCSRPYVDASLI